MAKADLDIWIRARFSVSQGAKDRHEDAVLLREALAKGFEGQRVPLIAGQGISSLRTCQRCRLALRPSHLSSAGAAYTTTAWNGASYPGRRVSRRAVEGAAFVCSMRLHVH